MASTLWHPDSRSLARAGCVCREPGRLGEREGRGGQVSASAPENRTSPCLAPDGFYPLHCALQWLSTTGLTPDGGPGGGGQDSYTGAHTQLFLFKVAHSTIPHLPLCAQMKPLLVQNHFDRRPFRRAVLTRMLTLLNEAFCGFRPHPSEFSRFSFLCPRRIFPLSLRTVCPCLMCLFSCSIPFCKEARPLGSVAQSEA